MRKKLDTRFPAARIKKIMQADEDVGKIAMAVPVLVSKALELFLQDLCDRTYDITVQRGAKTVSALHLKHCIHTYGVFDFLKDVVSKVPDYGHSDAVTDDRGPYKRRKAAVDECNDSDEESKKSRMQEMSHMSTSGRGRGRGRRGRGRGRHPEREYLLPNEVDAETSTSFTITTTATTTITRHHPTPYPQAVDAQRDNSDQGHQAKESVKESPAIDDGCGAIGDPTVRNIDLNVDVASDNQNMAQNATSDVDAKVVQGASLVSPTEAKQEQFVSEVDGMAIDPHQLAQAQFSSKIEEDEDYDEE